MNNVNQNLELKTWYDVKSAKNITDMSLPMINYLCREKIVVPAAGPKRGRGNTRRYTFSDLLMLKVIKKLLNNGVSVLHMKKSLVAMRGRGLNCKDLLTQKFVVTNGSDIFLKSDGVIETIESGQLAFAFVLELNGIREEVRAKILNQAA